MQQRRPWVSITVAALCGCVVGPGLLLDPGGFPPGPYEYTFAVMRPRTWGILFCVAAVLFIGGVISPAWRRHPEPQKVLTAILAGALALLLVTWAGFLVAAKLDPAGGPISWNGPGTWTTLAVCHLISFTRFGSGR